VIDETAARPERVLAALGDPDRGPTLIVVGGLHGNEPAGWEAAQRVAAEISDREDELHGRLVFLTGNRTALARGCRFVDRDLNRAWTDAQVERIRTEGPGDTVEDQEQAELLMVLDQLLDESRGTPYLLDLHTTSGPGGPFTTVADALPARELALRVPVPLVLGLEEMVDGTLHDWIGCTGTITVAFESGQHEESLAIDRAEAAIWIMIEGLGLLPPERVPEAEEATAFLTEVGRGLPVALEMRYRHPVDPGDTFEMLAGWENFRPVRRGEVLAHDRTGTIASPEKGRMLMPLYQAQGEDGFFIVREFSSFWLRVSSLLRHAGLASVVHWMPGIRRHPTRPWVYLVNRHVARWYALQILHLLGFRRVREDGDVLVVERRGVGH
jgi:succinylglutamate desuccinylase